MCGITGWLSLTRTDTEADAAAALHSMCEAILHRGPDSEGLWTDDRVALGMRRLSIIDLKTGDQPVFSCDKSVVVMMNGELYNYREVRTELEKRGHKFITSSDTEILPHLYEEYGEALVDHLNGMFAFALWDAKRQKLIIARDRFGEKPLYYGIFDGKLIWGSEPKAMLAHPAVNAELDLDSLRQYISYDYVPAPRSIYKGISKLPAAHMMAAEAGEVRIRRYWQLSWSGGETQHRVERHGSLFNKRADELCELLSDAVRMRLVADVPLGILLSGGIDSSTVAALATEHASERVKTFSIGFEEDSFDESRYARLVAKHLRTEHYEDKLSAAAAGDLIGEIGEWLDEPLSDGSLIPTYLLARFVRRHVTVALGGDGGDELFAGYPMYRAHQITQKFLAIPAAIRRRMIAPAVQRLPVSRNNMSFDYKAKRFIRAAELDGIERHHTWFGSFASAQHNRLLTRSVLENTDADIYLGPRELFETTDAETDIERFQQVDVSYYLAEDILTKVDRAAMAVSLETRAPFLDPRVGQFAAALPLEYKLRGKSGKHILKAALRGRLPDEILHRPKKGFGIPVAEWLRGRLRPLVEEMLAEKRLAEQGLFEPAYVRSLISEHMHGKASHHKELWTLLVFQLWYDRYLRRG